MTSSAGVWRVLERVANVAGVVSAALALGLIGYYAYLGSRLVAGLPASL